jgi:hypothetical protein
MVEVFLAAAIICFEGSCHPALIGQHTPTGEFQLMYGTTEDPGYGGSVLQFHETEKEVFAIHQLWLLKPAQKRDQRIKSSNPKDRVITSGCVNVSKEVYDQLVECCSDDTLTIVK